MKKLDEMNKKEKKEFLSMDLIERLIRLEQRVSASFGEFIPYYKTEYFKNLSEKERRKFAVYLNKNKRRKYVLGFFLFFLIMGAIFFRGDFTARVIGENINIPYNLPGNLSFGFFLIFIFIIMISFLFNRRRKKRINSHFDIIDKLYLRRIKK